MSMSGGHGICEGRQAREGRAVRIKTWGRIMSGDERRLESPPQ